MKYVAIGAVIGGLICLLVLLLTGSPLGSAVACSAIGAVLGFTVSMVIRERMLQRKG